MNKNWIFKLKYKKRRSLYKIKIVFGEKITKISKQILHLIEKNFLASGILYLWIHTFVIYIKFRYVFLENFMFKTKIGVTEIKKKKIPQDLELLLRFWKCENKI